MCRQVEIVNDLRRQVADGVGNRCFETGMKFTASCEAARRGRGFQHKNGFAAQRQITSTYQPVVPSPDDDRIEIILKCRRRNFIPTVLSVATEELI